MAAVTTAAHFGNDGQNAAEFRHITERLCGGRAGVLRIADTSLQVTEKGGTPDMSVDVAEGGCVIKGTEAAAQGFYLAEAQSTTNVAIAAADPTNERYDIIVARIKDQDYASGSPSTNTFTIEAITGTPAGSPADPTIPDNCVALARVSVPATDTSIEDAQITDLRWAGYSTHNDQDNGSACLYGGIAVGVSTARPQAPYSGMEFYETDTSQRVRYNGSAWVGDGIFVTYTPSHSGISFSSETARYSRVGDTITVMFRGTVSSVSGAILIGLPVNCAAIWQSETGHGEAYMVDATGAVRYSGTLKFEAAGNRVSIYLADDSGPASGSFWTTTTPVTWASADTINLTLTYEAV